MRTNTRLWIVQGLLAALFLFVVGSLAASVAYGRGRTLVGSPAPEGCTAPRAA